MRKLRVFLSFLLAFVLVACSSSSTTQSGELDLSKIKTYGDAYEMAKENQYVMTYDEKRIIIGFDYEGKPLRVIADMTKDVYDKMEAVDLSNPDNMDKRDELAFGLKVSKAEDLSDQIPSQEELDQMIGKKGQDLLDEGFVSSQSDLGSDNPVYVLAQGPFSYEFTFNEKVEYDDNTDADEVLKGLTVKSVKYYGIGDGITDIEE